METDSVSLLRPALSRTLTEASIVYMHAFKKTVYFLSVSAKSLSSYEHNNAGVKMHSFHRHTRKESGIVSKRTRGQRNISTL